MTIPIQPPAPVNTVITIQPVATAIPNRESTPGTNPLANLPSGTTVEGFVVNRDAQSNPILRTPLGDLRITSDVFLKTGSEVVFRVDTSQTSLARIVTVDGLSPQEYSAQASRGLTQDTISSSALTPTTANALAQAAKAGAPLPNAAVLNAIILQPTAQLAPQQPPSLLAAALSAAQSGPTSVLTQLSQLRSGASLKLTVLDLKLPPLPVALATLPESSALSQLLGPRPANASSPPVPNAPATPSAEGTTVNTAVVGKPIAPTNAETKAAAPVQSQAVAATPANESLLPKPAAAPVQSSTSAPASNTIPATSPQTPTASSPYPPASAAVIQQAPVPSAPIITPEKTTLPGSLANSAPAAPALTKPTADNQVVASVIGHDADGANILHTPFASLKVYTAQPLPTGTTLLLQANIVGGQIASPAVVAQTSPTPVAPASSAQLLAGLSETLQWLDANQPEVLRDAQTRLPNTSHQLASGLLSYIAGIKGGDVSDIIGKRATRLLEINAPEILARLRNQVDIIQDGVVDSRLAQWTSIPLPLLLAGDLHIAQLYIGKDAPESEVQQADKARGQRFLLEVDMSHLGPLQFDGFVRSLDKTKSFDLMVRSSSPLPADINEGIRTIFTNTIEITGMRGQVVFQQGAQHFVRPEASAGRVLGDGSKTILA